MQALSRTRSFGLALFFTAFLLAFGWFDAPAQTPPSEADLELGARLYAENCAVCHGASGEGRVGATLDKNWPTIRPDLRIRETIAEGIPGSPMPAWSQENGGPLNDAEIDALVTYILSWESGERIIPTIQVTPRPEITPVPNVVGDPNHGAVLYDQNCAVCHGANLEGRIGATLAKAWPSTRPDLRIRTTIANGIPGSPMPAWSRENGGPLTEAEVDDLVAFILSHPDNIAIEPTAPAPSFLEPTSESWLTGWGGVLLAVVGFIVVIALAIWIQTRP